MKSKGTLAAIAVILVLVVLLAGCGSKSTQTTEPATSSGDQTTQNTQSSGASTVILKNTSFQPNAITIKAGTEVTFENQDSVNHTVTGADFDSGSFGAGKTYKQIFGTPGVYEVRCTIHPSMKMTVTVQ